MQWLLSGGVTAGSLLGLAVVFILSGRLIPQRWSDKLVAQAENNAKLWKEAYEKQSDRADLAVAQMEKLLTGMATQEALLRALQPRQLPPPPGRGRH